MTSKTDISWHALAALAVLLFLWIVPGFAHAQSNSAQSLWDTYMDAAARANEDDHPDSAKILWESAIRVAEQMGPDEARLFFSRKMLLLTYFDLGQGEGEKAKELISLMQHPDVSKIDAGLLPFSRTLDGLASTYDGRWKKGENAEIALLEAEQCRMIQTAIQERVLTRDVDRAEDMALYGMVLSHRKKLDCADSKGDCASQKLQEALKYWDAQDAKTDKRVEASKRFSLLNEGDPAMEELSEDPIYVKVILAKAYYDLGKQSKSSSTTGHAEDAFRQAESLYKQVLQTWLQTWPKGSETATAYVNLGNLYQGEGKNQDAEKNFKQALQIWLEGWPDGSGAAVSYWDLGYLYMTEGKNQDAATNLENSLHLYEALEGSNSANTKWVATKLAEVLRKEDRAQDAQAIEQKYQLQTSNAPQ
jgi:tetratricopeptide (TPR) repeat protein